MEEKKTCVRGRPGTKDFCPSEAQEFFFRLMMFDEEKTHTTRRDGRQRWLVFGCSRQHSSIRTRNDSPLSRFAFVWDDDRQTGVVEAMVFCCLLCATLPDVQLVMLLSRSHS